MMLQMQAQRQVRAQRQQQQHLLIGRQVEGLQPAGQQEQAVPDCTAEGTE